MTTAIGSEERGRWRCRVCMERFPTVLKWLEHKRLSRHQQ